MLIKRILFSENVMNDVFLPNKIGAKLLIDYATNQFLTDDPKLSPEEKKRGLQRYLEPVSKLQKQCT